MLVIPAIDLLQGRTVRLLQGRYDRVVPFAEAAVDLARRHVAAGASWLHVVDLDGARQGSWQHLDLIAELAQAAGVPVQAGGGARDRAQVALALARGVARVIVSTAALQDEPLLRALTAEFGEAIAVSLDTRDGQLVTHGWTAATGLDLGATAERVVACGVRRLIHTDVLRDGLLAGASVTGVERLVPLGVPVMAAGGVGSYADLERLRGAGAEAAIVGRALLEGTIDLPRAITVAA